MSDESSDKVSHEEVVKTVQDSVSVQLSQSGNLSDEESGSEEVLQSEKTMMESIQSKKQNLLSLKKSPPN